MDAFSPSPPRRVALRSLKLASFRNYAELALELDGRPAFLTGPNGAGKTNLLEAISFLSPGRGMRRAAAAEVARRPGDGSWAVAASLETAGGQVLIGTGIALGPEGPERQRRIRIDRAPAASADALLEHVRVLWLTPAMDGLFTGAAADRRRFLDRLVLSIDPAHGGRASDYERALRSRNRLLEDPGADPRWLDAVEVQVAELGTAIAAARREAVALLARMIGEAPAGSPFPAARIALEGTIEAGLAGAPAGAVEDGFRAALRNGRGADRAAGRTLTGPHRSDLLVTHAPKEMPAADCSTGEQKALLTGLVLAHARLTAALAGQTPILLLDEVAAHLDAIRREALFEVILSLGSQAFMTGTDAAAFAPLGDAAQRLAVAEATVVAA